jgi:peptidoglycan lytic transglycosylase
MTRRRLPLLVCAAVVATGCATKGATVPVAPSVVTPIPAPRPEPTRPPTPSERSPSVVETGVASWYGRQHHGKKTASGEPYDMTEMTAAHRSLPLGTRVRVTNLANERSVVVRVNDRGPFVDGRLIDVSHAAARALGALGAGVFKVRLEVLEDTAAEPPPASR